MFNHVMVGSNDMDRSKRFYDALFAALGARPGMQNEKHLLYLHKGGVFMVGRPLDGQPATHANGGTIGFAADSPEQLQAWHDAGVAAGGMSVEDPPGPRDGMYGKQHLAYLRDPDGNKLCAACRPSA